MAMTMRKRVPQRIRVVMKRRHVSQTQLAEHVGKTQSQVSKWLRGQVDMTLGAVDQVAAALNMPIEELLGELLEEEEEP